MFSIAFHRGNANQVIGYCISHPSGLLSERQENTRCEDTERLEATLHLWQRTPWNRRGKWCGKSRPKWKLESPCDPSPPLLSIYAKALEVGFWRGDICTSKSMTAWLTKTKTWKKSMYPSTDECRANMIYPHKEMLFRLWKGELLIQATWMSQESTMLSERCRIQKDSCCLAPLCRLSWRATIQRQKAEGWMPGLWGGAGGGWFLGMRFWVLRGEDLWK